MAESALFGFYLSVSGALKSEPSQILITDRCRLRVSGSHAWASLNSKGDGGHPDSSVFGHRCDAAKGKRHVRTEHVYVQVEVHLYATTLLLGA